MEGAARDGADGGGRGGQNRGGFGRVPCARATLGAFAQAGALETGCEGAMVFRGEEAGEVRRCGWPDLTLSRAGQREPREVGEVADELLREAPGSDGLRVLSKARNSNGFGCSGVDDKAGDQHAAEVIWEVLEEGERRADADAEIVVGGRSPRGPVALHPTSRSSMVESCASPAFMRPELHPPLFLTAPLPRQRGGQ